MATEAWNSLLIGVLFGCVLVGYIYRRNIVGFPRQVPAFLVFAAMMIITVFVSSNALVPSRNSADGFFAVIACILGAIMLSVVGWMIGGLNAQS